MPVFSPGWSALFAGNLKELLKRYREYLCYYICCISIALHVYVYVYYAVIQRIYIAVQCSAYYGIAAHSRAPMEQVLSAAFQPQKDFVPWTPCVRLAIIHPFSNHSSGKADHPLSPTCFSFSDCGSFSALSLPWALHFQ